MNRKAILTVLALLPALANGYTMPTPPFSPPAGEPGSTAIPTDDPRIRGWASSVVEVNYGLEVAEQWRTPDNAIGPADPSGESAVVLGRGGMITLLFDPAIVDGPGFDFAVFENAFSQTFLELAWVEVSSDGIHFVRLPNYSLTAASVPPFGHVDATMIHGLAGKYRRGFGTPFDLAALPAAWETRYAPGSQFSGDYIQHLEDHFPHLDLDAIRFVRIIDIVGDGTALDAEGFPIYDPYPTLITAGFDLTGVAVLNQAIQLDPGFIAWCEEFEIVPSLTCDSDLDGWADYLEYRLNGHPLDPVRRPAIRIVQLQAGRTAIEFEHNGTGVSRVLPFSSLDLIDWQPAVVNEADAAVDSSGRMRVELPANKGFIRFAVDLR